MDAMPLPASAEIAMQRAQQAHRLDGKMQKSAKEFEAMFMSQMISHMFEGMDVDPMFGGGHGEKMFRSLLTQEYGRLMADGQNTPVSHQIKTMMLKIQEQQQTKG